jgi:hypothetical protein
MPRHHAGAMKHMVLLALGLAGCVGENLPAGSEEPLGPSPARAPDAPTTLATLHVMIDTLAMDATDLYFTAEDGYLYKLPKVGASPSRLAAATAPGSEFTEGLAMDADSLYWTANGDGMEGGRVLSVSKSGGAVTTLAANQTRPTGIAVDGTSVYWANQGAPPPQADSDLGSPTPTIMSIAKTGGTATVLFGAPETPDALTLDDTGVIWHEARAIRRIPKTGGDPTTLAAAAIPWASTNLVVSGGTLFFGADQGGWSLDSVPLTGTAPTTLTSLSQQPGSIFVAGSSVFWNDSVGSAVGAIRSIPLAGGTEAVDGAADLVPKSTDEQVSFLLADESAFYWVEYWEAPALAVAIRSLQR